MSFYSYRQINPKEYKIISSNKVKKYTVEQITFPSPYDTDVEEAKNVYVFLHVPPNPKAKLLFLHGLGDRNLNYLMWFAKYFASHSIATAFMVMPYNAMRASADLPAGKYYMEASTAKAVERFRHAVIDARATIDLLDQRFPRFSRTHLMGISFGGMISTITAGVDKRVDKLSLVITGGNFRYINWLSPMTKDVRTKYARGENQDGCGTIPKCVEAHKGYMSFVKSIRKEEDIYKAKWKCFIYDPLSFAPLFRGDVIMFRAAFDRVIPHISTIQLWEAFGKPRMHTIPSGHFLSILFKRSIGFETLHFFQKSSQDYANDTVGQEQ